MSRKPSRNRRRRAKADRRLQHLADLHGWNWSGDRLRDYLKCATAAQQEALIRDILGVPPARYEVVP